MMSVNDMNLVMQPSFAVSCLTLQHFNAPDAVTTLMAPHNLDVRQCVDHDDWPPPLLFNVAWLCCPQNGPQFMNLAQQHTRDIYYHNDDENGDGGDSGDGEPDVDVLGVDQKHYQQRLDSDVWAARQEQKKK
jgi:hypothetical protein